MTAKCGPPTALVLFAFVALSGLLISHAQEFSGRELLQQDASNPIILTDRNITDIADELGSLEDGSVLVLAVERVTLNSSLRVAKSVTIRGESIDSRTEITCAGGRDSPPAFEIQATATLENLIIKGCGGPAVRLSSLNETLTIPVSFHGISFEENIFQGSRSENGAAIGAQPGFNVTVDRCNFTNNTAAFGAGIFISGSNLTVKNSYFIGNTLGDRLGRGAAIVAENFVGSPEISLTVSNCSFVGNTDPAGYTVQQSDIFDAVTGAPLEKARFVRIPPPAHSGGAISAQRLNSVTIEDSNFTDNIGTTAGGAVSLSGVRTGVIQNCNFIRNEARNEEPGEMELAQGGAVYVELLDDNSRLTIKETNFVNNSGGYGGGAHFVGHSQAALKIEGVGFFGNHARSGGGALVIRNIERVQMQRTELVANVAQNGGGLLLANGASIQQTGGLDPEQEDRYEGNVAVVGGGLAGLGAGVVTIEATTFSDNHALLSGGGIAMIDGTVGTNLVLEGVNLVRNSARRGGGLFIDSIANVDTTTAGRRKSNFSYNAAIEGGGIFFQAQARTENAMTLIQVNIASNAAITDFTDFQSNRGDQLDFFQNVVGSDVLEALQDVLSQRVGKLADLTDLLGNSLEEEDRGSQQGSDRNLTRGAGAGALLGLFQGFSQGGVAVSIEECAVENNIAAVGAGLLFLVDGSDWQQDCERDAVAQCRSASLKNVTFNRNGALSAGAAIFATNPQNVYVQKIINGTRSLVRLSEESTSALSDFFADNSVASGGFGIIASLAHHLEVVAPNTVDGFIETANPMGHNSIDPLPPFILEVRDAFNQKITGGIPDTNMSIEATSESITGGSKGDVLSGGRIALANKGTAEFIDAFARALNGSYRLKFSALDQSSINRVESEELKFLVRDCMIGEQREGFSCRRCRADFFSLIPEKGCSLCPKHSFCPGGAAVIPDGGFWHSTPFSPEIHRCLLDTACEYEDRQEKLQSFFESITETRLNVTEDEYRQCDEGYEGTLCGSCSEGFGKLESACVKCEEDRALQRFYIFLVHLWSLALLAFTIRSAVTTGREMEEMNNFIHSPMCTFSAFLSSHGRGAVGHSMKSLDNKFPGDGSDIKSFDQHGGLSPRSSGVDSHVDACSLGSNSGRSPSAAGPSHSSNTARPKTIASRHVARELERFLGHPHLKKYGMAPFEVFSISGKNGQKPEDCPEVPIRSDSFKAIRHIVASELLSETVKIGTNFLQVTSFAIAINSDWSESVRNLLGAQDLLAGFSAGSSLVSTDCALSTSSSVPPAIRATLITIFSPAILMVAMQLYFLLSWLFQFQRKGKAVSYLISHAAVTAITAIFFAYSNVTEELFKILNCVTVDKGRPPADNIPEEYSQYSTALDKLWVEDTEVQCFKDEHMYLAYIISIPGIVLFTCGMPLLLLFFLITKKDDLYTENYLRTYGFVYEAYEESHMYWEVLIMVRKVLVAAVVVYGYSLGPSLQAVLSLGVLIIALVLHVIVLPYKYDRLNELEGLSLVVTTLTIYSGLIFVDKNTNDAGRTITSVFILFLNIVVVLVLVFEFHLNLDQYLESKIEHYGGTIPKVGGLPIKIFELGKAVVKSSVMTVNAYGPGQGGFVVKVKRAIARAFGWTVQYNNTQHATEVTAIGSHQFGAGEGIQTIPEERSADIESSASQTKLSVEGEENLGRMSAMVRGNQQRSNGVNDAAIELAPQTE